MENITNILQRLQKFIDYKGLSINKFSVMVGASNSYFGKMFKNNGSIGSEMIEKILRIFPDLNSEWLLLGSGEMIKPAQLTVSEPPAEYQRTGESVKHLQDKINVLEAALKDKQRIIELLEDKIKNR